jgi:hypothetical protein
MYKVRFRDLQALKVGIELKARAGFRLDFFGGNLLLAVW